MITAQQEVQNKTFIDLIRRMAYLAEHRINGMDSHIERIREYCLLMARHKGLPSMDAETIAYASMLHDIGKSALPDSILLKAGKLTHYELELVKRHTELGAQMLAGSPSLIIQAAQIIALNHHERWDGSGYPQNLEKYEVPMSARICALADVFDALTTERPYKESIPLDDGMALIEEQSGILFDPELVDLFIDAYPEVRKIYESHP